MKANKKIGVLLIGINLVLIIFIGIFYLRIDRGLPRITFSGNDAVYEKDMDQTELLNGVSAMDNTDGDVTERVVVEKIVENEKDATAVVYYAVSDRAGNVSRASRVFPARYSEDETKNPAADAKEGAQKAESTPKAEETAAPSAGSDVQETIKEEPEKAAENTAPLDDDLEEERRKLQEELVKLEEEKRLFEAEKRQFQQRQNVQTVPMQQETEPAAPIQPEINTGKPILTLRQSEVTVPRGTNPAWVDLVFLSDDRDKYETLFRNLHVSKFDVNKPGAYPVSVYTEDSDGNVSDTRILTVIVK